MAKLPLKLKTKIKKENETFLVAEVQNAQPRELPQPHGQNSLLRGGGIDIPEEVLISNTAIFLSNTLNQFQ